MRKERCLWWSSPPAGVFYHGHGASDDGDGEDWRRFLSLFVLKPFPTSEGEFTCLDGQCINIEQRCDQTPNCRHQIHPKKWKWKADTQGRVRRGRLQDNCYERELQQDNCAVFLRHRKAREPAGQGECLDECDRRVEHQGGRPHLQPQVQTPTAVVWLQVGTKSMQWQHTKHHRVKYHNLKRERSLNALSLEELSSLWVPPLVFENTADNEAMEGTKDSEVWIFAKKTVLITLLGIIKLRPGYSDKGRRFHPKQSWGGWWGELFIDEDAFLDVVFFF